jgi:hypothetical protein
MKITTALFSFIALTAVTLVSGCAKFEYTGREFAAIPEDTPIAWYTKANPVPAGKYRVIGRGELVFGSGDMDNYDVEERLLEEARKRGADAVMLQSTEIKQVGSYERDYNGLPSPSSALIPTIAVMPDGSRAEVNSFGDSLTLSGEQKTQSVVIVRATFYKEAAEVQKLIDEQSIQLLKLEKEGEKK